MTKFPIDVRIVGFSSQYESDAVLVLENASIASVDGTLVGTAPRLFFSKKLLVKSMGVDVDPKVCALCGSVGCGHMTCVVCDGTGVQDPKTHGEGLTKLCTFCNGSGVGKRNVGTAIRENYERGKA